MNVRLSHLWLTEQDLAIWGDVLERFTPGRPATGMSGACPMIGETRI